MFLSVVTFFLTNPLDKKTSSGKYIGKRLPCAYQLRLLDVRRRANGNRKQRSKGLKR